MLNGESVPELNAIAPLPQEDREIVSAIMDGPEQLPQQHPQRRATGC
jgi:hypothetical protein